MSEPKSKSWFGKYWGWILIVVLGTAWNIYAGFSNGDAGEDEPTEEVGGEAAKMTDRGLVFAATDKEGEYMYALEVEVYQIADITQPKIEGVTDTTYITKQVIPLTPMKFRGIRLSGEDLNEDGSPSNKKITELVKEKYQNANPLYLIHMSRRKVPRKVLEE